MQSSRWTVCPISIDRRRRSFGGFALRARMKKKTAVSIERCAGYKLEQVTKSVRASVEAIGGIDQYVRPGERVLVKPNLLAAYPPERAVTTHPIFLIAVIKLIQDAGAKVLFGDSPSQAIRGVDFHWRATGMDEVAARTGAQLVNFEGASSRIVALNNPFVPRAHITRISDEVDRIVAVPKLKTHGLTLFTGAVKGQFGMVPGLNKSNFHKIAPNPDDFAAIMAAIYQAVPADLVIMDGIVGMQGNGPANGEPGDLNLVIAGEDGVAVDYAASRIIGFRDGEIGIERAAVNMRLGVANAAEIDFVGVSIEEARVRNFKLPSNALIRRIPRPVLRALGRFVVTKPVIDNRKCTRCMACVQNCPVNAVAEIDGRLRINEKACIECLCCQESCEFQAVFIRRSFLARCLSQT